MIVAGGAPNPPARAPCANAWPAWSEAAPAASCSTFRRDQPGLGSRVMTSLALEVDAHGVFPLAIGELPHVAAVPIHQEHLRVGLRRRVVERCFILEAGARAFEPDLLARLGPGCMRVGAARGG